MSRARFGRSLTAALEHSNRLSLATEELLSGEELLRLSRSHLWSSLRHSQSNALIQIYVGFKSKQGYIGNTYQA